MRFFTPLPCFIEWLSKEAAKTKLHVMEVGCGDGDLLRDMRKANIKCMGFDPYYIIFDIQIPIDLVNCIFPQEAQHSSTFKKLKGIVLVCRPCHSGFPAEVYHAKHSESPMYYVGFEGNIPTDLDGLKTKKVFNHAVGEEGEFLFKVL